MLADFPPQVKVEAASLYQQRKLDEKCTRPGCESPPRDDANQCHDHSADEKKRKRKHRRKRKRALALARKMWRRKKLCLGCGGRRLTGEKRCAKCIVHVGRAPVLHVPTDGTKKTRIEAVTTIDADGRSRYRGQGKRGRQSVAQLDDQDLRFALEALQKSRDGLAFIEEQRTRLSKLERKGAISAALALALHSSRLVEDVLERHGFFADPIAPDPKPGKR